MSTVGTWGIMPINATTSPLQSLSKLLVIVLCALLVLPLCSCAVEEGEQGAIDQAKKYAKSRLQLDASLMSAVNSLDDVELEIALLTVKDRPDGLREIELVPTLVSDTMASWDADEWAWNRGDLFFNFGAHFKVICKQAHDFSNVPENYVVTCPNYMVVYDSQRTNGFIVTSTGVYRKTEDPANPIGETIALAVRK